MPARLSVLAVKRARILAASGVNPGRIARDFGFDEVEVTDAVRGVTFSFISSPPPVYERPGSITGLGGGRLSGVRLNGAHLRKIRETRLRLSQERFARRMQEVGNELGLPNRCSKRLVQKWEDGSHAQPTLGYRIILVEVTGVKDFEELCKPMESPSTEEADVMARLASLVPVFPAAYRELVRSARQLGEPIPEHGTGTVAATAGTDDGRSVVGAVSGLARPSDSTADARETSTHDGG